ncbi:MAG: ABC transporter ATP-binding protein [Coriobacteriaceae bacterium]|jgi:ABC-2 type transport system ATP-binding protein|nr:ABC transporter ATP-binding protein [Coriobacteriaceae bacterium]
MIEIKKVSKTIQGTQVLCDIEASLPSGRVTGFSGINGSGKTMLMRVLAGLIRPSSGEVLISGKALWKDISFPESIGFLIEGPAFIGSYTGLENLMMIASIKKKAGMAQVRQAIERVGLDPDDKRRYRKYSLGMKQRLGIALAVMEAPDIVLLDEPTNALDADGVALLEGIVREERARGAAVVLSCHDHEVLERLSDSIYYLQAGRVVRKAEGGAGDAAKEA